MLDTSLLNPYELADLVESFWLSRQQHGNAPELTISLISFSYQRGIPLDADMVVDVRFLPNPHYQPELASLTGMDEAVARFLGASPEVGDTLNRLTDWLHHIWDKLKRERKQYFTLAIGCSGGRHRSVYMVENIADWMRQRGMNEPLVRHREIHA
jgi:UPF0042 nucleotide-binding protein